MHTNSMTWPASPAMAPRHRIAPRRNLGERHPKARLTDHEVELLREMYDSGDWSLRALGRKFEVRWETVRSICYGRTR